MPSKVVAPPRPTAADTTRRGPSRSHFAIGAAVLVVVVIVLAVALSSSSSGTPTKNLGFRDQIVTSLADSKRIAATFARVGGACKTIQCVGVAAGVALSSEGNAANLVHQTEFPAGAITQAEGYVQDLIGLQQDYKVIAETSSRSLVARYVATAATDLKAAESDARLTESALG